MGNEIITEDGEILTTALVPSQPQTQALAPVQTVAQARVDSIAKMLDAAYQRASLLELTDEESRQLLAPFPDEDVRPGAKGKEALLYIEHMSIRSRLLEVFGPGRWVPVCRRMWTEEFGTEKDPAVRVYADIVLLIRGCYAGEAIGAGTYYPKNAAQDYSDAAEAAESEALRRIGGKKLGIGLQVWNKAWCDGWKARRSGRPQQAAPQRQPAQDAAKTPPPAPAKKVPADYPALLLVIGKAAAKLTTDGYPTTEAALQARVLSAVSAAGVKTDPKTWTEGMPALKIARQALDAAYDDIKAGKQAPVGAEELNALYGLQSSLGVTWGTVAMRLKLPNGLQPPNLSREQYEIVMKALRAEAEGKAEPEGEPAGVGADEDAPF